MPYNEARALTSGWGGRYQAHHLTEVRLLKQWNYTNEEIGRSPAVVMKNDVHQGWTNRLRRALPYGHEYTPAHAWPEYKQVYSGHSRWLKVIHPYFRYRR
jgi:hypothetical protein